MRLALVVWSLSPVFLVWAIRGSGMISQLWLWVAAMLATLGPALIYLGSVNLAKQSGTGGNLEQLTVKRLTDRREHLLSYLFPLLLSVWSLDFKTHRELLAFFVVISFTGIAFWHLQLTYVNIWFAIAGYRSVQVERVSDQSHTLRPIILLTRNGRLCENTQINALRITNNLYLDQSS